jgi:hypothetical protein
MSLGVEDMGGFKKVVDLAFNELKPCSLPLSANIWVKSLNSLQSSISYLVLPISTKRHRPARQISHRPCPEVG